MKIRRSYPIFIVFNGRVFNEVQIDSHYEENHSSYMNDELILTLVKKLNREFVEIHKRTKYWKYFELNQREHMGKYYKMILCIHDFENFIGVVNCYRSR